MVRSTLQRRLERRQSAAVLGLRAIEPVGCDHLDTLSGQQLIETVTIVSFVTDDSGRCALNNHESKELLDEVALGGVGRGAASRYRQPLSVDQDHDLDAFANPSATDAIAPALGFGKSAIDETFVEPEPPGVFHAAARGSHQGLENTGIDPLEKPAVNRALRTKTRRKTFDFAPLLRPRKRPQSPVFYRRAVALPPDCVPHQVSAPKANPTPLR